ncbi:DUF3592 domain-containing protein [Spirochaetota bacterium]
MKSNITKINALLIIISVVLIIVAMVSELENNKFKEQGIETKANIMRTYRKREASGIASRISYKADITFFTENVNNDFISTNIYITKELYDTLKSGHELIIYYLPENPEEARLKSSVSEFSSVILYVISGGLLFVVLILSILVKKSDNKF